MENEGWKQTFKQWIADYQKVAGSWRFKETTEEKMEAFKEEQELEKRASIAERFLSPPSEPRTPEQVVKQVEESCEYLGVESSEILRQIYRKAQP